MSIEQKLCEVKIFQLQSMLSAMAAAAAAQPKAAVDHLANILSA